MALSQRWNAVPLALLKLLVIFLAGLNAASFQEKMTAPLEPLAWRWCSRACAKMPDLAHCLFG
jgi:hypothetical protein